MAGLSEVPTDELLSFQEFSPIHNATSSERAEIKVDLTKHKDVNNFGKDNGQSDELGGGDQPDSAALKSFWTLEYYQKFFDVDTRDVTDRIIASIVPRRDNFLKNQIKYRPDLYGPFWISITLIFTIGISGNIASYLQHANTQYHWKYDFHLVSYAATTIIIYISLIPLSLWGLMKWSSDVTDLDGLEVGAIPSALEVVCVYGYSLFIYIPVSILWSIQVGWLQWMLVILAAVLSGSVLLLTLLPALRLSRHTLLLSVAIISCHLMLAAGFMLYFFHVPNIVVNVALPKMNSNST